MDAGELTAGPLAEWPSADGTPLATQSEPTKQPTVVADAINNRAAVRFDGSGDRLALVDNPFANAAMPRTLFVVYTSDDYQGHLIGTGADAAGQFMSRGFGIGIAANKPFVKARSSTSGVWLLSPENVKNHGPQILSASVASTGSEIRTGCHITSTTTAPSPTSYPTAHIGGTVDGEESFAGDIAEILLYDRTLTADEHASVWNYLADKYGIEIPAALDIDDNGVFDACDTGAVYLNAPNISVTLVPPTTLHQGEIASIIDAPSATATDPHTDATHVWAKGDTVLLFDLQGDYQLETIHFWNFTEERFDVDNIQFEFLSAADEVISEIAVEPQTGFEDILAEDFPVDVSGVRYVRATLTATNNEVEFQNIGFTGVPLDD